MHDSAATAVIGDNTRIWNVCHICTRAQIGIGCVLGQNVFVAPGVRVGSNVTIQNNVSIYEGVELDDDVFCGASCVFTNVANPRSQISRRGQYTTTKVGRGGDDRRERHHRLRHRNRPLRIPRRRRRRHAPPVPDHALMVRLPRTTSRLDKPAAIAYPRPDDQGIMRCPKSNWRYCEVAPNQLRWLDRDEDARSDY